MGALPRVALQSLFLVAFAVDYRRNSTRHAYTLGAVKPDSYVFLEKTDCGCVYSGCSCEAAMRFMQCIKDACNSHKCKCLRERGDHHFQRSCSWIANDCQDLDMACASDKAECDDQAVTWDPVLANYVHRDVFDKTVREKKAREHRLFGVAILIFVVILCSAFALTLTGNAFIVKNTYFTLDLVIVTFMALSWYYVVMHFLSSVFDSDDEKLKTLAHISIGVTLLTVSTLVSWTIRESKQHLLLFHAIFTPIVMWCFVGILSSMQDSMESNTVRVFVAIIALCIFYVLLALVWYALGACFLEKGWDDETVNKAAGASVAAGLVHWTHMLVSNDYQSLEDPHAADPGDTIKCNILGAIFLVVAVASTPLITQLKEVHKERYWTQRLMHTFSHLIHFMPKYSIVLSLHHLISYAAGLHHASVETNLIAATLCTVVAVFIIILCAHIPFLQRHKDLNAELIGISGFIIGTTWAGLLNNSINMMQEGAMRPLLVKFAVTLFLTSVILPVYLSYLKPLIQKKTAS